MQTKQKWALTLTVALGAISCGGSTEPGDPYMGFIDGTALDSKFQTPSTCGKEFKTKCTSYEPVKAYTGGEELSFYNLGYITNAPKDADSRPVLPASAVKGTAYDFPEGCKTGKEYNQRTDAYREDMQYPVLDTLPLKDTSNGAMVLPLVKVQNWTGVSQYTCNAIKNAQSLRDGDFGGAAAEGESYALRAVIDMTYLPARPSAQAVYGWYRGLQLAYLDGGAVPVEADGNLKVMDGVWVKTSSATSPTAPGVRLVLQAKPGEEKWSPVVRLREVSGTGTYTRLCYDPPCAEDAIDMTAKPTYTGVLFLVASPQ
ncbi:hypothetical protein JQX13_17495 [Archangium violaceum]|uniref:hypothetical protein n=1 Tax=Archangium violaceum TaxID=83451 RepID=UPI00193BD9B1|nr:hypothetical protein [Archangium violaceum]QRK11701.1 hypothetical protein JQX13_17495 [Archangium violaceum]